MKRIAWLDIYGLTELKGLVGQRNGCHSAQCLVVDSINIVVVFFITAKGYFFYTNKRHNEFANSTKLYQPPPPPPPNTLICLTSRYQTQEHLKL